MKSLQEIIFLPKVENFSQEELFSIFYHDLFDYPLTAPEIIKWTAGDLPKITPEMSVESRNNFFYNGKKNGLITKRAMREKSSRKKILIAQRASFLLSFVPTVKLVAITGALAMKNASEDSDIDFLVVTRRGSLWLTRIISLFLLKMANFGVRRYGQKDEKDKLCLNIWLDESDLVFKKRNFYTAHEIAQIIPLVNKGETYERFLNKNKWILRYWPNAVRLKKQNKKTLKSFPFSFLEKAAMVFQYWYMKRKITQETVTPTRALFHPVDWSHFVMEKLTP